MKKWALSLLVLAACTGSAESSRRVRDYEIERLFTQDGCTVYRFRDAGWSRYFVKCADASRVEWSERCGKNCTRSVEIETAK